MPADYFSGPNSLGLFGYKLSTYSLCESLPDKLMQTTNVLIILFVVHRQWIRSLVPGSGNAVTYIIDTLLFSLALGIITIGQVLASSVPG